MDLLCVLNGIEFFIFDSMAESNSRNDDSTSQRTILAYRVNIETEKNKISFLYNIVILLKITFFSVLYSCVVRKRISFSVRSKSHMLHELLPYNSFINKNSANNNAIILEIDFYYVCKRIIKYENRKEGLVVFSYPLYLCMYIHIMKNVYSDSETARNSSKQL